MLSEDDQREEHGEGRGTEDDGSEVSQRQPGWIVSQYENENSPIGGGDNLKKKLSRPPSKKIW